jgi:hypothetical protein
MSNSSELPRWYKFRSFGVLRPGFMKVEFIPPPQRLGSVTIHHVFVDELPLHFVPTALRMPNTEFWAYLSPDHTVTEVRPDKPSQVEDYE